MDGLPERLGVRGIEWFKDDVPAAQDHGGRRRGGLPVGQCLRRLSHVERVTVGPEWCLNGACFSANRAGFGEMGLRFHLQSDTKPHPSSRFFSSDYHRLVRALLCENRLISWGGGG